MGKCIKPKVSKELRKLTNKFKSGKISSMKEYNKMMRLIKTYNIKFRKYHKCK